MGYNSDYFKNNFLIHTHTHTYKHTSEIMLYLKPPIYFKQVFFTVQQYGSKWIAVLSLKRNGK